MLCCAFFLFPPKYYLHKSRAIFHINMYILSICTEVPYTAPMNLTIWSGWPSFKTSLLHFLTSEWIIFAVTGVSLCSPLFKTPFATVVLNDFLLSMKGSSSTNQSPSPSFFSDLVWQTMLPNLIAIFLWGTMVLRMRVDPLASSLLLKSMKHCSQGSRNCVKNANTSNHTLIFEHSFKEKFNMGFFI